MTLLLPKTPIFSKDRLTVNEKLIHAKADYDLDQLCSKELVWAIKAVPSHLKDTVILPYNIKTESFCISRFDSLKIKERTDLASLNEVLESLVGLPEFKVVENVSRIQNSLLAAFYFVVFLLVLAFFMLFY